MSYCNILRDDGLSYGDYPGVEVRGRRERLNFLLFQEDGGRAVQPPFNKPSPVPAEFVLSTLLKPEGDDLETNYCHALGGARQAFCHVGDDLPLGGLRPGSFCVKFGT